MVNSQSQVAAPKGSLAVGSFKPWCICLIASLFFFYEFIQLNMFNALSGSLEQAFHLTILQMGVISAFYFLADSVVLYPIGYLLDCFSCYRLMLLGMVLCVVATFLICLATNPWFLVASRVLSGLAGAFCLLSILRLASGWFPANQMARITGVVVTIGMLGGAVSQAPLSMLIIHQGWKMALFYVGLLGVVILLAMVIWVKDAPQDSHGDAPKLMLSWSDFWSTLRQLMCNHNNWLVGIYVCTMNLPLLVISGLFGTAFMVQAHGMSEAQGSTISMMPFIGTIVGSSFWGFYSDFCKKRRQPMVISSLLSIVMLIWILWGNTQGFSMMLLWFFILGFVTAAQVIGYPVAREINPPQQVGSVLGFISVLIMGFPGIFQPLVGWIMGHEPALGQAHGVTLYSLHAYQMGLLPLVVALIVSLLCALCLPETYRA